MRTATRSVTRRNGEKTLIAKRREGERTVAFVRGTSVHVWAIAGYARLGMSAQEIIGALPHLTLAQVRAALKYAQDHREEIETALRENELAPEQAIERRERFTTLAMR
jgi:uncharacterized protein (DUF433 family)